MTTDKTGAPTTVSTEADRFTIAVDGQPVGLAEFADRDGQRLFIHTEVADGFEGRGLATILIAEALQQPATPGCGSSGPTRSTVPSAAAHCQPALATIVARGSARRFRSKTG